MRELPELLSSQDGRRFLESRGAFVDPDRFVAELAPPHRPALLERPLPGGEAPPADTAHQTPAHLGSSGRARGGSRPAGRRGSPPLPGCRTGRTGGGLVEGDRVGGVRAGAGCRAVGDRPTARWVAAGVGAPPQPPVAGYLPLRCSGPREG